MRTIAIFLFLGIYSTTADAANSQRFLQAYDCGKRVLVITDSTSCVESCAQLAEKSKFSFTGATAAGSKGTVHVIVEQWGKKNFEYLVKNCVSQGLESTWICEEKIHGFTKIVISLPSSRQVVQAVEVGGAPPNEYVISNFCFVE